MRPYGRSCIFCNRMGCRKPGVAKEIQLRSFYFLTLQITTMKLKCLILAIIGIITFPVLVYSDIELSKNMLMALAIVYRIIVFAWVVHVCKVLNRTNSAWAVAAFVWPPLILIILCFIKPKSPILQ